MIVTGSAPSHCLDQYWLMVNCKTLMERGSSKFISRNKTFLLKKCVLKCCLQNTTILFRSMCVRFNSSPPSVAYIRQWIGWALVQIMACRLFGAKPLSKPMLCQCQLDPKEQTSVKFQSKYKTFHSRKCIWKYRLRIGGHFVQGEMS